MPKTHIIKDLVIDEVTFCKQGMNQEADITLFKSEDIAVYKATFTEVLTDMELGEKVCELMEYIWDMNQALRVSIVSVMNDEEIKDKKKAIKNNLGEFINAIGSLMADDGMLKSFDLKKWFEDHPEETFEALQTEIQTTLNKEEISMAEKTAEEKLAKAEKETAAIKAELKKANRLATLNDAHREFYNGLEGEAQDTFLAKSEVQREKVIAKANEAEELLVIDGATIRKSVTDPGVFAALKSQQARLEKAEKTAADTAETAIVKAFEEQGKTNYPNLPGSDVNKGKLVRAVAGMDKEVSEELFKMLDAANAAVGKTLTQEGNELGGDAFGKSDGQVQLDKLSKAYAEEHNVSFAKAQTAVLDTPEGQKIYGQMYN